MVAPTLTGLDGAAFAENTVNATPQVIDSDVSFTDADNDYDGGTLAVSGLLAEDRVSVASDAVVWLSGGDLWYDADGAGGGAAVLIGTATGGVGATFTVTFGEDATAASIEALIERLAYANVSDTPTASRGLTINVTDAAGNDLYGEPTFSATAVGFQPDGGFIEGEGYFVDAHRAFADVDGDGDLDLVCGDYDGYYLRYFENVGTATAPDFVEQYGEDSPFTGIVDAIRAYFVDLDADGDLDLVTGEYLPDMQYFENVGTATAPEYVPGPSVNNPLEGTRPVPPYWQEEEGGFDPHPTFGDLDGDGDLDLILGEMYGHTYYFENQGSATDPNFQQIGDPEEEGTWGYNSSPSLVDLNGDGVLDYVVRFYGAISGPFFRMFENYGTPEQRLVTPDPLAARGVGTQAFADLDGDGDLDLISGHGGRAEFDVYENITTRAPTITITVTGEGEDIVGTAAADILAGTAEGELIQGRGGDDSLQGLGGDDRLEGGGGADRLDGGSGDDEMTGGAGADIYVVDSLLDTVTEGAGGGPDTIESSIGWTLGAYVEHLALVGAADIDGVGNELANQITGNDGDNLLSGLAGADTLSGGAGNDILVGGEGVDRLAGGDGADIFVIAGLDDGRDRILDLDFAEGDRIDLSGMDADAGTAGDQAFTFVTKFTGVAGQARLVYDAAADVTRLRLDIDGDRQVDLQIVISGNHAASGGNLYTGGGDSDGGWIL